jgi:hypothetical protein
MNLHLSSNELLEKYPELKTRFKWTSRNLNYFLKSRLLVGYYNQRRQRVLIAENSVLELMKYTQLSIEEELEIHKEHSGLFI